MYIVIITFFRHVPTNLCQHIKISTKHIKTVFCVVTLEVSGHKAMAKGRNNFGLYFLSLDHF